MLLQSVMAKALLPLEAQPERVHQKSASHAQTSKNKLAILNHLWNEATLFWAQYNVVRVESVK
jgi:hypothetical protein